MTRIIRTFAALAVLPTVVAVGLADAAGAAAASSSAPATVVAVFEDGTPLDLTAGWGPAQACHVGADGTRCFSSEAAMDAAVGTESSFVATAPSSLSGGGVASMSTCSPTLKLYDGTSYTGAVLSIGTQGSWINLAAFGFDNRTSSYVVGACAAIMADAASGGGSWYPGSTGAGASAASMLTGWNNRISSVYQY